MMHEVPDMARCALRGDELKGEAIGLCPDGYKFPCMDATMHSDVLVQKRRDKAAAKRFFQRVLRSNPVPRRIVTDQLRSYPAAKSEIPEIAHVKQVFGKAVARVNSRAENSHQPTRRLER
ncbi:transposase-like protein [Paraburkholderia sp. JPY465]